MLPERIAEIEDVARRIASTTAAAYRRGAVTGEVRAQASAADGVLWALAHWRAARSPKAAKFRVRRVHMAWHALRPLLDPGRPVDAEGRQRSIRNLEPCDSRGLENA